MGGGHSDRSGFLTQSHFWDSALSRRQFLGASAIGAGAFATAGLWKPLLALAGDQIASVAPRPIPGGITVPFTPPVFIHHFPPVIGIPLSKINDPATITDFNGFVGVCRVRGQGVGTDTVKGTQTALHYQVDNGFMDGVYVGADGKDHRGTFAFVWMDLYNGPVGSNQVHDFSPGIPPSGLFWTQAIAKDDVEVRLGEGTASVRVRDLKEEDATTLFNALEGVGARVPSTVSFDITWTGSRPLTGVTNASEGFTGEFMFSTVTMQWSAKQAGFTFISDPASPVTSLYGVMGRERNGVFFTG